MEGFACMPKNPNWKMSQRQPPFPCLLNKFCLLSLLLKLPAICGRRWLWVRHF
uniref:Uncharacterized protein n=1 Tax=Rhizophora mucronata TaxID=61149 RepID=A0A2P2PG56_RHIMU